MRKVVLRHVGYTMLVTLFERAKIQGSEYERIHGLR